MIFNYICPTDFSGHNLQPVTCHWFATRSDIGHSRQMSDSIDRASWIRVMLCPTWVCTCIANSLKI